MKLETVYFLIFLAITTRITWLAIRQVIRREEHWGGVVMSMMISIAGVMLTAIFGPLTGVDSNLLRYVIITFASQFFIVFVAAIYGNAKRESDDSKNVLG